LKEEVVMEPSLAVAVLFFPLSLKTEIAMALSLKQKLQLL
jgi:hypothetical protein